MNAFISNHRLSQFTRINAFISNHRLRMNASITSAQRAQPGRGARRRRVNRAHWRHPPRPGHASRPEVDQGHLRTCAAATRVCGPGAAWWQARGPRFRYAGGRCMPLISYTSGPALLSWSPHSDSADVVQFFFLPHTRAGGGEHAVRRAQSDHARDGAREKGESDPGG